MVGSDRDSSLTVMEPDATRLPVLEGTSLRREGTRHFPNLDGYRAVAALSVVAFHLLSRYDLTLDGSAAQTFARLGRYGVIVFLILSGFLLYRRYALALFSRRPPQRWTEFYTNRALRIFPAYVVVITVGLVLLDVWIARRWMDYAVFYSLTQVWSDKYHFGGLPVAWSLSVELSFYVALPFIAWFIRTLAPRRRGLKAAFQVQMIVLVLLWLSAYVYRWAIIYNTDATNFRLLWLPGFIDSFALGMMMGAISAYVAEGRAVPWFLDFLSRRPWLCLLIAAQFYWLTLKLNIGPKFIVSRPKGNLLPLFSSLSALFLLLPGFFGPQDQGLWRRFLSARPVVFLGEISYGIFLWHLLWLDQFWPGRRPYNALAFVQTALVVIVLTVMSAAISYHFIERPALALKFPTRFRGEPLKPT